MESEPGAQSVPVSNADVDAAVEWISERAGDVLGDAGRVAEVEARAAPCSTTGTGDARASRSAACPTPVTETASTTSGLRRRRWGTWSAGWSLREVEPETNLLINLAARGVADRPGWAFGLGPGPAVDEEDEDDTEPADEAGLLTAQPVPAAEGEPNR